MKMWKFVIILVISTLTAACPEICRCSGKKVYCNDRQLRKIPENIPTETEVLYLQDNELQSSANLDLSLSKLRNLEKVMLYGNKLTSVPKLNSRKLRHLSLNSNR